MSDNILNAESFNNNSVTLKLKISKLIKCGRKEITTKKELMKYKPGTLISYINKKGIFRSAGFLDELEDNSFIYLSSTDFKTRIRVKYTIVDKMWVGDVYNTKNDIVSISPSPKIKTKYFVDIGNIIVYYATDSTMINRFKCTQKYERMQKWYERYGNSK